MLAVFTKCSFLYLNIPVGEDHIVCISQVWTIVNKKSGFKILFPVPDNFTTEQCAATFDTHALPAMGYSYYILFDPDTLLIPSHIQS